MRVGGGGEGGGGSNREEIEVFSLITESRGRLIIERYFFDRNNNGVCSVFQHGA